MHGQARYMQKGWICQDLLSCGEYIHCLESRESRKIPRRTESQNNINLTSYWLNCDKKCHVLINMTSNDIILTSCSPWDLIHFSPRARKYFGIEIITYVRGKKERNQGCRQCKTEAEIHHRRNNNTNHDLILRHDTRYLLNNLEPEAKPLTHFRALSVPTLLPAM